MRYALSLCTLALALVLAPLASARADAPAEQRWKVGAYVEQDLGILLLFGGVGLYGGVTVGNLRAGVGFNRFESPYRALSGAPDGFGLKVSRLFQLDVSYHPFSQRMDGPYVRAVAQLKRQHAENLDNGVQRDLDSVLVGPELGWVFRVYEGVYLAPRAGAFYYVAPPQGAGNHPIDIGGAAYDNDKHKTFDFFGTLSIGYVFQ